MFESIIFQISRLVGYEIVPERVFVSWQKWWEWKTTFQSCSFFWTAPLFSGATFVHFQKGIYTFNLVVSNILFLSAPMKKHWGKSQPILSLWNETHPPSARPPETKQELHQRAPESSFWTYEVWMKTTRVSQEVSKWLVNGCYNLLINGVYSGYNPFTNHLLTSWDIQVVLIFLLGVDKSIVRGELASHGGVPSISEENRT